MSCRWKHRVEFGGNYRIVASAPALPRLKDEAFKAYRLNAGPEFSD